MRFSIMHGVILLLSTASLHAQEKSQFSFFGKISQEYRTNFLRLHDTTQVDDYRTNLFFSVENRRKIGKNSRLNLYYELRHHRYDEFLEYNRHDHLGNIKFQTPFGEKWLFAFSNELRLRKASTVTYSYLRNIANFYTVLNVDQQSRAYFGIQHWSKDYFETPSYQHYSSVRLYTKLHIQLAKTANLGIHAEYNNHKGNLYPGSRGPDLNLELDGQRFIFITRLDKIFAPRLFTTFAYRFENDFPMEVENKLTGQRYNDETYDELLAEDSDFGYFKNQYSISSLIKVSSRLSLLVFYNIYNKEFKFWRIEEGGPVRKDQLIFLSHLLKIKINKKWTFELQHNFEDNRTNLEIFKYKMNTVSAGLSVQF
ncbi:hypothetical protein KC799_24290 [candidate division KSB1 bacterium]|nr:hypothetical protein [candidate division KSB1 bacterium]